jgi:hypothetical protein
MNLLVDYTILNIVRNDINRMYYRRYMRITYTLNSEISTSSVIGIV